MKCNARKPVPWISTLAVLFLCQAAPARAHRPSDSTLTVRLDAHGARGRWEVAVRDLDHLLGLDLDGNGEITWGEIRSQEASVAASLLSRLAIRPTGGGRAAGACPVLAGPLDIQPHSDGAYAAMPLSFGCALGRTPFTVEYTLLFDADPGHRGYLHVQRADGTQAVAVFSPEHRAQTIDPAPGTPAGSATWSSLRTFVVEGILHIWAGFDHILFLIALLLPAVLRRDPERGGWTAAPAMASTLGDVARIVTAFTVAHSLTLSLAALGLVSLPPRLVESAIAASVVLAALNNLWPLFGADRWVVALALGLLHGFGFSSVLADVGLPRGNLLAGLVGFNLGVEIGQLVIVAAFVPLAFCLRHTASYRRWALRGGSAAIAFVSTLWLFERLFGVTLIS